MVCPLSLGSSLGRVLSGGAFLASTGTVVSFLSFTWTQPLLPLKFWLSKVPREDSNKQEAADASIEWEQLVLNHSLVIIGEA